MELRAGSTNHYLIKQPSGTFSCPQGGNLEKDSISPVYRERLWWEPHVHCTVQTGGHNNPVILHTYSNKKNRKGKEGREGREKKGFPQLLASNI